MNMTTTRRNLIKLASALGLAGTIPTNAERVAAAQVLDQEFSSRAVLDPGTFAKETHMALVEDVTIGDDWYGVIAPEEEAAYLRARGTLDQALEGHGIDTFAEVADYDAAATALYLEMYNAGLRHGASYEHLRRSMVGEIVQCVACRGTGLGPDDDGHRKYGVFGVTCTKCGGTGTVALKA